MRECVGVNAQGEEGRKESAGDAIPELGERGHGEINSTMHQGEG